MLLIRADAQQVIGSGHVVRCSSYAAATKALGKRVVFAVSEPDSATLVHELGFDSVMVEAAFDCYTNESADELLELAECLQVDCILVDSYFVGEAFFKRLQTKNGLRVAYIDDMYQSGFGVLNTPKKWPVDIVINYSFEALQSSYSTLYSNQDVKTLLGPHYAPVRQAFACDDFIVKPNIESVLVTSGSTNPDDALEKMVEGVFVVLPHAQITVVVGAHARFDASAFKGKPIRIAKGLNDLSVLMKSTDLAVSAAGSTLYELSCVGVPTIAVPIVGNQLLNAKGFSSMGVGLAVESLSWSQLDVSSLLAEQMVSLEQRTSFSVSMRRAVDELGSARVAEHLS